MNIFTDKPMSDPYPEGRRIDFPRFQNVIYPVIKGNSQLGPHVIWDQIKLYIKGSAEAVVQQHDLTKEQYCEGKITSKRIRLIPEERLDAYAVYLRYREYQHANHLWDDCDRANGYIMNSPKTVFRQFSRQVSTHGHPMPPHTGVHDLPPTNSKSSPKSSSGLSHRSDTPTLSSVTQSISRSISRSRSQSGQGSVSSNGSHNNLPSLEPEFKELKPHATVKFQRQTSTLGGSELRRQKTIKASTLESNDEDRSKEKSCWPALLCL